jgi:hypothetical protein
VLHEKIADEFLDKFITLARSIRLGNPLDAATEMGPLTSAQQKERVLSYVDVAKAQGGEVLAGGKAPAGDLARGCYLWPRDGLRRDARVHAGQERVGQLLGNVYLHYVLDLWFETEVKPRPPWSAIPPTSSSASSTGGCAACEGGAGQAAGENRTSVLSADTPWG